MVVEVDAPGAAVPERVAVNEIAPDFVLPGVDGTPVQLSALRGRKVVLFFYPRDESPVCVVQVCAFRDAYEELTSAGVEVVGISSDSPESHHAFALQHQGRAHRILVNGACKRRALDALVESIVPGRRGDLRPPTAQELAVTAVLEFPLEEVSAKVRTGPAGREQGRLPAAVLGWSRAVAHGRRRTRERRCRGPRQDCTAAVSGPGR